ncbi:MAG: class I SAM-dependent methyltransferase [Ottowia sp.]|uniref:class I SAM-dependent methyltransferase n=1 Tax=Ottowia sp. TaxID=1898956 RepID=UPI003C71E095
MPHKDNTHRNWFDQGGKAYSRFRPEYPPELARFLASVSPSTALAVDVGCGNGQLTTQLAAHFDKVLGTDPSADQIAHAAAHPHVEYANASAEELFPVADHSADLITAAQAAHWFDLPRFYEEVRRIGAPHAVLALVSYGVMKMDDDLDPRFSRFYWNEIGPYWPAERKLVDSGYVDLPFPFEEQTPPSLEIRKMWNLEELLGYISTWSAVRSVREAAREEILQEFAIDLAALWGDPSRSRQVSWPINMRLGTL